MMLIKSLLCFYVFFAFTISSCGNDDSDDAMNNNVSDVVNTDNNSENEEEPTTNENTGAKVVGVNVSGNENAYAFNVTISSPDTGCDQYADWWEVITENGDLIFRRILAHSHVTEQPFTRSGSGISITEEQTIIVRAHMNTSGYGTQVYKGSVSGGFAEAVMESTFANELATAEPLPDPCAF